MAPNDTDYGFLALDWAMHGAAKPDVLILNTGIHLRSYSSPNVSVTHILGAYEAVFQHAAHLVAAQVRGMMLNCASQSWTLVVMLV